MTCRDILGRNGVGGIACWQLIIAMFLSVRGMVDHITGASDGRRPVTWLLLRLTPCNSTRR
jgi:hypothetical protein